MTNKELEDKIYSLQEELILNKKALIIAKGALTQITVQSYYATYKEIDAIVENAWSAMNVILGK